MKKNERASGRDDVTHYREGYYIVARTKKEQTPSEDEGWWLFSCSLMFSDMQEFLKFQHM